MNLRKDQSLDELANHGNVAQFISFEPTSSGPKQAYARLLGLAANQQFPTMEDGIAALLASASDKSLNVRCYTPENPRSREFLYGLADPATVVANVRRLTAEGLYTIVNETIDVHDGGVSGVAQAGIIEFAPDDTPRCVEKPGTASLPFELGLEIIESVYGFRPELKRSFRTEFSIHPRPRGWKGTHILLWEHEQDDGGEAAPSLAWPNHFSRHIGDKVFGLLMAFHLGLPVPRTTCFARRVAPFTFGFDTGSHETWVRTAPRQQEPGYFTTHRGWLDPFKLLADEDPDGTRISSVLAQQGVPPVAAGASIIDADGKLVIEGVLGGGDRFMLGQALPEQLPASVHEAVAETIDKLMATLGPVRTEWVFDGEQLWIVQLHRGATISSSQVLVPGDRSTWIDFEIGRGLEDLRALLAGIDDDAGVELIGQVGMTSHIADLVRKSGVPTRIVAAA